MTGYHETPEAVITRECQAAAEISRLRALAGLLTETVRTQDAELDAVRAERDHLDAELARLEVLLDPYRIVPEETDAEVVRNLATVYQFADMFRQADADADTPLPVGVEKLERLRDD